MAVSESIASLMALMAVVVTISFLLKSSFAAEALVPSPTTTAGQNLPSLAVGCIIAVTAFLFGSALKIWRSIWFVCLYCLSLNLLSWPRHRCRAPLPPPDRTRLLSPFVVLSSSQLYFLDLLSRFEDHIRSFAFRICTQDLKIDMIFCSFGCGYRVLCSSGLYSSIVDYGFVFIW